MWATGKQQLNDKFTALMNRLGVCIDLHAFPYGAVAGSDKTGFSSIIQFHRTQTTGSSWLESLMVAEGGDINAISFSNLKDILSFLSLDFFPVKLKGDHISFSSDELWGSAPIGILEEWNAGMMGSIK